MPKFLDAIETVADKIWPDADERAKNQIALKQLDQNGAFRHLDIASGNIQTEAKSDDPWTSRARPSFLYVMYIYLLAALPIGLCGILWPEQTAKAIEVAKAYLASIPAEMWTLFGAGYLGYVKKRSDDKEVAAGKEPKKFLGLF
jgi:hypothetical protein